MVPTTGVEGAKQLIIRTKRWFRSPESDEEAAVALVDTADFCGPARRGESALGPRQEMSCAKGARSSSGSSSFSQTCRFDSGATQLEVMGWHTTSKLTWRPITALVSDETWAELRLTNAAFACSHESRRAASRPTADVEEAVLVHGTGEEQDGAVTQQPNSRSWNKSPVEGDFMLSSRPNPPEQGDSRQFWVKTFLVG